MKDRLPLASLGVCSARDLCALDANPPPLSFARDLLLPPHPVKEIAYETPKHLDTKTYWQPSNGGPG
ncbi:MAG: hypothetical protein DI551_07235 [Micavibrio aeruginosavorus]|uniref:Uncharacterized protein n=1 Tax=Micavibrio aeruginosavorus TaxID=349221 RepID=A0A2W5PST7_9BACT|nr:MAG: hypothetical protein DI551_07235 [Micavibrio aeruginosavorus]